MRSYDIVQKALVAILVATTYASPAPEPAPAPAPEPHWLDKRSCVGDNCLRALRNRIATATPFCATYTTDAAATIPTWATSQCASNPTKVTSACGCLATATLTKVYGPVDGTKYTIYDQSVNIRSDPGDSPDEFFNNCFNMCSYYGAQCQTFSFVQMANNAGNPGGLYLCYIYGTSFQPALVETATNWLGNVVYQRTT